MEWLTASGNRPVPKMGRRAGIPQRVPIDPLSEAPQPASQAGPAATEPAAPPTTSIDARPKETDTASRPAAAESRPPLESPPSLVVEATQPFSPNLSTPSLAEQLEIQIAAVEKRIHDSESNCARVDAEMELFRRDLSSKTQDLRKKIAEAAAKKAAVLETTELRKKAIKEDLPHRIESARSEIDHEVFSHNQSEQEVLQNAIVSARNEIAVLQEQRAKAEQDLISHSQATSVNELQALIVVFLNKLKRDNSSATSEAVRQALQQDLTAFSGYQITAQGKMVGDAS